MINHICIARLTSAAVLTCLLIGACRQGDSSGRATQPSGTGATGGTASNVTATPAVPELVMCTQYEPDRLLHPTSEIGRELEQLVVQPAIFYGNSYTAQSGHLLSLPSEQDGTLRRNDDGTLSVIVHYRDGIRWSDGEPFKTSNAVLGIRAVASTNEAQIVNVTEGDALSIFLTTGDGTEYPYFPANTPLPTHIFDELDPNSVLQSEYARIVNPSLGPYFVSEWQTGQQIRFVANPNYTPPPTFPAITVLIIPDAGKLVSMLASGQCQVALDPLTPEQIDVVTATQVGTIRLLSHPSAIYDELVFNTYASPLGRISYFADARVRQAVAHALDKSGLATSAGLDTSYIMQSWVPDNHWAFSAANAANYPHDPVRAAALLDQAGWTDQDGNGVREYHGTGGDYGSCMRGEWAVEESTPFSVTLLYAADNTLMAETADQLKKSLSQIGIGVTIQGLDSAQLFDRSGPIVRRDFDFALIPSLVRADPGGINLWVGEDVYLHPVEKTPVRRWQLEERWLTSEQLVEWLAPNNIPSPDNDFLGQNYSGWCDDGADVAIVQANRTLDLATRANFYAEHQRLLNAALPAIPLLLRPQIIGFSVTICGIDSGAVDPITWNIALWRYDPSGACN